MRLAEFQKKATADLSRLFPEQEARSIVSLLITERLGVPSYTAVTEPEREIATVQLEKDMERLLAAEPVQYVLGFAEFYGRRFRVTPDVLIPRPETEELVEAVLSCREISSPRILDLCTGSGCIAWTLALEIPGSTVVGVDISDAALDVAKGQFDDPRVTFVKGDVLSEIGKSQFDVIVSNPPYVTESERAEMRRNVLDYEPALALFVPDDDPLKFYRALARHAEGLLAPGGYGIFEVNCRYAEGAADLLRPAFTDVTVLNDISGRPRFVSFRNDGK